MPSIRCFVLEPTGRAQRSLRRYVSSSDKTRACPLPFGYHDASRPFDVVRVRRAANGTWRISSSGAPPHRDRQWPKRCACGYRFLADDQWQLFSEVIYRRTDTREEMTLREAPVGAMWNADWMSSFNKGADGRCLVVKTPGGEWMVDGDSYNSDGTLQHSPGWTRSGEWPDVTASPSILMHRGGYHGWLRGGYLVDA